MSYVFCYGMITASTVYLLDKGFSYPMANTYAEVAEIFDSVGGEAVNTAIILSKLGVSTKLDGNWLNAKNAPKMLALLKPFGIDVSRLTIKEHSGTEEIVISDAETRTFFGNFVRFHAGEIQWNTPCEEDVIHCSMVAIDPYFKPHAEDLARLCIRYGKPFVTLDCRHDSCLARHAEALIISHELRDSEYKNIPAGELFALYQENCNGLVIFTSGSEPIKFGRKGKLPGTFVPFKIKPVDTTGAGDAFRGGIIYGLLQNWSDYNMVEFASAVSASVCLSIPHTLNALDLNGIMEFIENYRKHP
jgi:sugar/nucleoside kinase (ribokinase family)